MKKIVLYNSYKISLVALLLLFLTACAHAQVEKQFLAANIDILTSPAMHGRGYVGQGAEQAAIFLQRRFREYKLQPVKADGTYIQGYDFSINTFPGSMSLAIGVTPLQPGADFLVDAGSPSYSGTGVPVKTIDLGKITDKSSWRKTLAAFDPQYAYCLLNVDTLCKTLGIRPGRFSAELPKGCFIIPQKSKLTWTVEQDTISATVFYLDQAVLPPTKIKTLTAEVSALWIPKEKSENILGCVPGTVKDTFIAFTAHYDHLGMMGDSAYFPGASDNASGTAMLLYLASYFSKHPQHYSILFIAFSGEEPGLLGSAFYVAHPIVPLGKIKFLTNIDIMGDATDGVTVVNATEFPAQFSLLNQINDQHHYIPIIKSRGKAANSDHYHFTDSGVPSFFIYSNGGKGYYHDIYDKAAEVTLNHVDGVARLLIDFTNAIN